jgi:hypothetical protein
VLSGHGGWGTLRWMLLVVVLEKVVVLFGGVAGWSWV